MSLFQMLSRQHLVFEPTCASCTVGLLGVTLCLSVCGRNANQVNTQNLLNIMARATKFGPKILEWVCLLKHFVLANPKGWAL